MTLPYFRPINHSNLVPHYSLHREETVLPRVRRFLDSRNLLWMLVFLHHIIPVGLSSPEYPVVQFSSSKVSQHNSFLTQLQVFLCILAEVIIVAATMAALLRILQPSLLVLLILQTSFHLLIPFITTTLVLFLPVNSLRVCQISLEIMCILFRRGPRKPLTVHLILTTK